MSTYKSFPILSTPKSSKINKKSKKLHLNIELVKIKICNVEVKIYLLSFSWCDMVKYFFKTDLKIPKHYSFKQQIQCFGIHN